MSKNQRAKELVNKAMELRGSKSAFLLEVAGPIREEITKIKLDNMLSPAGKSIKIKEVKEKETKRFMYQVALRKQAYQQYLTNAKNLAKETIEKSFVSADDGTRAKFQREFSELKFKMALKTEKGAFEEIKSFVEKTPDPAYASLILENFHELAGKFNAGELKVSLSKTYDQLKADFTPEEISEAFDVIDHVDASINNKMFTITMAGDDLAANPEYNIIGQVFSQDALKYYQDPETYFAKKDEPMPVFVDPDEEVEEKAEVKKPQGDPEYVATMKSMNEMMARLKSMNDGGIE